MLSRILLTAALTGTLVAAKDQQNGFEGKWVLDNGRSAAMAAGGPEDLQTEIKQKGSNIVISSRYKEPQNGVYPIAWVGIMSYELKLAADGSETVNWLGPFQHKSKTTVNGNTMRTEWTAQTEKGNAIGQWIRTLSSDGKEMTLQVLSKISDGRSVDKTLYLKRK